MHRLKIKIEGLYCLRCAEQITKIIHHKFKIKEIKLEMEEHIMVISSKEDIRKDKLAKEISRGGYGIVSFLKID